MTTVLYSMVTNPKHLDTATREHPRESVCIVCGSAGALQRAGMTWCTFHSTPVLANPDPHRPIRSATARWYELVKADPRLAPSNLVRR